MAYVPNAQDATQPTGDKAVASAAPEFRTLKTFTNTVNLSLANFQAQLNAIQAGIGAGNNSAALAANLARADSNLFGAALVGFYQDMIGHAVRTLMTKARDVISVTDFGAVLDNVTDDTAAFNRATRATEVWASNMQYDIHIPSGQGLKAKLNGTVYCRKGQSIGGLNGHGAWINATGNTTSDTFVLGRGLIAGVPTTDPGGAPVKISNLYTEGGAAAGAIVATPAAGFEISSLFMTFPGQGIRLDGGAGDGIINGIQIDQCLSGISMVGAQNITLDNYNIYLPNFGVIIGSGCNNIVFGVGVINYSMFAGILFDTGASNIRGVCIGTTTFDLNVQHVTFLGHIVLNASNVELSLHGTKFYNMKNWAINHSTGVGVTLSASGCVFDGLKTNAGYAQSTTAKVINTGVSGNYSFYSCEERNLPAEIATVNDNLSKLDFIGGLVSGCDANAVSQKRFNIVTAQVPNITVKGVVGFGYQFASGANQCVNLPYWGASTAWKVAARGNKQNLGDSAYSAMDESIYTVTWQNNAGTKSIYADKVNLWQTPNRTNPGQLAPVVCLGTAVGGAASSLVFAATGSINISVPITNASNFDFYCDTAT